MRKGKITRAEFLRLLAAWSAGVGAAGLLPRASIAEEAPAVGDAPPDSDSLVRESIVIDALLYPHRLMTWPRNPGEVKRLTGIDAACWPMDSVDNLAGVDDLVGAYGEAMMRIEKVDDIGLARAAGKLGLIYYAARDWTLRGSLEPLARWHAGGLRALKIADEGVGELGGGHDRDDAPLTAFGKRVVAELNRLGIAIDVSHCGERTTLGVAAASSRPVFSNHGNAAALAPHSRNKSDEEIVAIARTGGVLGITTLARYLRRSEGQPASLEDFIAQVDHVVQRVGIDHVGLCSDTLLDGQPAYAYDRVDSVLNSQGRWFGVAAALRGRGYPDDALRKLLGLNLLRAYRAALG